jgi:hypothetical protein
MIDLPVDQYDVDRVRRVALAAAIPQQLRAAPISHVERLTLTGGQAGPKGGTPGSGDGGATSHASDG